MPTNTRSGKGTTRKSGRGGGKGSNSKERNEIPHQIHNHRTAMTLAIRTHRRITTRSTPETIHKQVILLIRLRNHQRNYSHIPTNLDNDTSSAFVVHPVTGEPLRFPFITDEMKTDDYFNADFDFHH